MREIVTLLGEQLEPFIKDDIVRPNMSAASRVQPGRKSYALRDGSDVLAIICVAYGHSLPTTEDELDSLGLSSTSNDFYIIPYTLWSYSPGAGRELINGLLDIIKVDYSDLNRSFWPRVITMSPKTEMAKNFHLKNGAKLISENAESNNFEYLIR